MEAGYIGLTRSGAWASRASCMAVVSPFSRDSPSSSSPAPSLSSSLHVSDGLIDIKLKMALIACILTWLLFDLRHLNITNGNRLFILLAFCWNLAKLARPLAT